MKICMIGTGYVGLVTGVCFADLGNDVICVDRDYKKIKNLKNGIIPIYEPGLEELVIKNYKNKNLNFSTSIKDSIKKSDIIFICVGTPTKKNSSAADLSQVYSVAKEIKNSISKFKIIITKSTVPLGTGDEIEKIIYSKKTKKLFSIVSNPEFLREGEAIRDFTFPDRIIIGTNNKRSNKVLKNLYSPLISKGAKYINTSRRAAELIKYSSNAFLATKITFINEIANLCEKSGVNIEDISIGMGLDVRIGSRFLRPGPAYGGSCFPKDTKAIINTADKFKTNLSIIKSVVKSNESRPLLLLKRLDILLNGKFKKKKVCFLGVTFKANTDDMRDAPSLKMIPFLLKKGAIVNYYDPTGEKSDLFKYKNVFCSKTIKSAISNADLIIMHTEWNDFKSINFKLLVKKKNYTIFDLRNIYSPLKMKQLNIRYFSIGR